MKGILVETQSYDLDIRVKRTGKLITSGLIIGNADEQIAEHVLRAHQGEFKETPLIGAAVSQMINGQKDPFWANRARDMLIGAGLPVTRVIVENNQITIE